jgi:FHA domain
VPRLIIKGQRDGRVVRKIEFAATGLRIGRDSQNEVVLDDPDISRFHAEIRVDAAGYRIVDLQSTNGISVEGHEVAEAPLVSGTVVGVGPYLLEFQAEAPPAGGPGEARSPYTVFDPVAAAPASDPRSAGASQPMPDPPVHRAPAWRSRALLFAGTALAVGAYLATAGRGTFRVPTPQRPPETTPDSTSQSEVARHLAEARRLIEAGDSEAARRELDAVAAVDPSNQQAATLREALGRMKPAR